MWKCVASKVRSWTTSPSSSKAITRAVRLGLGWAHNGNLDAPRRSGIGPALSRSTTGSRGDAMATQMSPSLPRDMLSG